MSSRCCLNCYFLFKSAADAGGKENAFPWKTSEREQGRLTGEHWTPSCYKRVWNANRNPISESEIDAEISKKRKRKECPFFEYQSDLTVQEVEELQPNRKSWWQRAPGIVWSALVVIGLVLGIAVSIVGLSEVEWIEENAKAVVKWLGQLLGQDE